MLQIFQAKTPFRWKVIKTISVSSIILSTVLLIIASLSLIMKDNHVLPILSSNGIVKNKILKNNNLSTIHTKNKDLAREKKILKKEASFDYAHEHTTVHKIKEHQYNKKIRAAFYVNWDRNSFRSLEKHIHQLNMMMPEWFFIQDSADSIATNVDLKAYELCKQNKVSIVPMVSNFFNGDWKGENVKRVISSKDSRTVCINSILKNLKKYDFQGINIDFENMNLTNNANLVKFQQELYNALHAEKFIVTQDVSPFNEDYDYEELQKYNDYLMLMAYDQHSEESIPGPIAHFKWVEKALDECSQIVPDAKIILGLPAYGYDWPENALGTEIDFQNAVSIAQNYEGNIVYDETGYNLKFNYVDDANIKHQVHFTDAATIYNLMRLADDYGLGGVSLWRLGAEDSRMWSYFGRELSTEALQRNIFLYGQLNDIKGDEQQISYIGEGEILDLIATPKNGSLKINVDNIEQLISAEKYLTYPSSYLIRRFGKMNHKIVLTFDDGPEEPYTSQILDILKQEKVPGVFFVTGLNAEKNIPLLQRIYEEGHEIGNHTFSHPNLAKISESMGKIELSATRRLIECIIGHSTVLFRPPYRADADPHTYEDLYPIALAKQENYYTIAESIDPLDWQEGINEDSIVNRVIRQEQEGNIILLHDAGGDRSATVKALPRIIHYFKSKGYTFTNISGLSGKSAKELMPAADNKTDTFFATFNGVSAFFIYLVEHLLYYFFFLAIFLSIGRLLILVILALIQKKRKGKSSHRETELVSVIIPAYNEELTVCKTISTLLNSTYKNIEIIVIDDGSKDNTYETLTRTFSENRQIKILTKPNGGKAAALNYGIHQAYGDIVVCIDADTLLNPEAIEKLLEGFEDERIGAVAGNVRVGNEVNIITKWQSIEYTVSQNFDRRAFDLLNCITVIPGAIGAFRKKAIIEAGGFTTDTVAEDCDITIRMLKNGNKVTYTSEAIAYTEAPETIDMFLKQRLRWSFGIMQCVWKNKNQFFRSQNKALGWIALPNLLLFQIILPLLAPFADIYMLFSILSGYGMHVLSYYIIFVVIELAASALAISMEKTHFSSLWTLPFQRIVYRQLMYYVIIKSIFKATKGEIQSWGAQKRTGHVRSIEQNSY